MPKDKLNQITVASHFRVSSTINKRLFNLILHKIYSFHLICILKNSLAELLEKMKDAEPLFVRLVTTYSFLLYLSDHITYIDCISVV